MQLFFRRYSVVRYFPEGDRHMSIALLSLILLSFSAPLALVTRKKIEEMIPLSVMGIIFVLYISGLRGNLAFGFYLIVGFAIAALAALVYMAVHHRSELSGLLFTPGLLAFLILVFLIWRAHHLGRMYTEWDEVCHWGLFTRNMYSLDQLYNVPGSTAVVHPDYPPATSLFNYFALKLDTTYRECNTYYAANIFLYSLILPVFKHFDNWKKPLSLLIVFGITFLLPFTIFSGNLYSIYVDTPLGFFFAYVLFQYFSDRNHRKPDLALLCLSIFILTLLKPVSIGFSLLACLLVTADILFFQKVWPRRQKVLWIVSPFLSVLVAHFSWSVYLKLMNIAKEWSTSAITPSTLLALLRRQGEEYQYETYHNFVNYFCGTPLRYIAIFIFLSLLFILLYSKPAYRRRLTLFLGGIAITFFVFSLIYLILYLFIFSSYEAPRLASIDRYFSTYYYAMFGFLFYAILDSFASGYTVGLNSCPILLVCMVPFLCTDHLSDFLLHPDISAKQSIEMRSSLSVPQTIVDALDLNRDRVYVIDQQGNGYNSLFVRYQLTPMEPASGPYSLGPAYDEEDAWTTNISVEEWADLLQDYTHVYIVHTDDQFKNLYGSLFEDPATLEDHSLYRIEKQGDNICLVFETR